MYYLSPYLTSLFEKIKPPKPKNNAAYTMLLPIAEKKVKLLIVALLTAVSEEAVVSMVHKAYKGSITRRVLTSHSNLPPSSNKPIAVISVGAVDKSIKTTNTTGIHGPIDLNKAATKTAKATIDVYVRTAIKATFSKYAGVTRAAPVRVKATLFKSNPPKIVPKRVQIPA